MEAATEMSTPCCCFRNKGALQSGSAPAGLAGFDVGGGTQHRLFHRGNQGPLLEKAKQIFPNKNRSREMHSFHHGVFYMYCDFFLLPSTHDPPFNLCHFQQSSSPTEHRGSAAPAHCSPAAPAHHWRALLPSRNQCMEAGREATQEHGTSEFCPFQPRQGTPLSLGGCLLQIPLLPGGAFIGQRFPLPYSNVFGNLAPLLPLDL